MEAGSTRKETTRTKSAQHHRNGIMRLRDSIAMDSCDRASCRLCRFRLMEARSRPPPMLRSLWIQLLLFLTSVLSVLSDMILLSRVCSPLESYLPLIAREYRQWMVSAGDRSAVVRRLLTRRPLRHRCIATTCGLLHVVSMHDDVRVGRLD